LYLFVQELLGERLVTAPVSDGESLLPSPNQLRYKIILKNKKLRRGNSIGGVVGMMPLQQRHSTATAFMHGRVSTIDDPTYGYAASGGAAAAGGGGNIIGMDFCYPAAQGFDSLL
jgi:hypothetical protein